MITSISGKATPNDHAPAIMRLHEWRVSANIRYIYPTVNTSLTLRVEEHQVVQVARSMMGGLRPHDVRIFFVVVQDSNKDELWLPASTYLDRIASTGLRQRYVGVTSPTLSIKEILRLLGLEPLPAEDQANIDAHVDACLTQHRKSILRYAHLLLISRSLGWKDMGVPIQHDQSTLDTILKAVGSCA